MNHEHYRERLQLSLYGELTDSEQHELEQHLLTCTECQVERVALQRFHTMLTEYQPQEATDRLLNEARLQLRGALRVEQGKQSLWDRIVGGMREYVFPQYKLALGGIALLAAGIFLGRIVFNPSFNQGSSTQTVREELPIVPGDTRITNVRFINSDPTKGEIEFAFEAVKPVRMKGSINDERIQKILTHALLNEQNPGVRLQSISAMALQKTPDREVKSTLIAALTTDENPGVRKEALLALKNFSMDNDIKRAFLFVLTHDRNPGLRIAAINYLDSARVAGKGYDQDVLSVLREKMQSDDNNYIRTRAKAAIEEIKQ